MLNDVEWLGEQRRQVTYMLVVSSPMVETETIQSCREKKIYTGKNLPLVSKSAMRRIWIDFQHKLNIAAPLAGTFLVSAWQLLVQ